MVKVKEIFETKIFFSVPHMYITIFSLLSHIDSVMSHRGVIKLVLCPISLIWSLGGGRSF